MTREQIAGSSRKNKKTDAVTPETETELGLSRVWKTLLGGDHVDISVDDSFFALGR
jgi:hypothetical protein